MYIYIYIYVFHESINLENTESGDQSKLKQVPSPTIILCAKTLCMQCMRDQVCSYRSREKMKPVPHNSPVSCQEIVTM